MVRVSVILPVYNGATYMNECLQSLRNQTLRDIEVIVVNDGSTDSTEELLQDHDDWASIITNPARLGISKAINKGLQEARGEHVSFIAHDDLWMPRKLEVELKCLEDSGAEVVYSDYIQLEENGIERIIKLPNFDPDLIVKECFINISSAMISKAAIDDLKSTTGYWFDESLSSAMDWDFWIRLSRFCRFCHVPEVLSVYRRHSRQTSRSLSHHFQEVIVYTRYNGFSLRYAYKMIARPYVNTIRRLIRRALRSTTFTHRALGISSMNL